MGEDVPLPNLPDLAIEQFWIVLAHDRPQLLHDLCLGHSADPLFLLLWFLILLLKGSCGSFNAPIFFRLGDCDSRCSGFLNRL